MSEFSNYVYAMGRGPSKGRNLDQSEARDAMAQILAGDVAPEAVGALLMLMRYRGETAAEIAGFVEAMRARISAWADLEVGLDWPSYAAGRSRGLPWFVLSAKLIAQSGVPVMLHGWNSHQGSNASVVDAVKEMKVPVCSTPEDAKAALGQGGIAYVPLADLDARLLEVLRLREVLGLRSAVNTALRALNPTLATCSVQGVFHPPYRALQRDSAMLLGQPALGVLKGGGGEFERHPGKDIAFNAIKDGASEDMTLPAVGDFDPQRLADGANAGLADVWSGTPDEFAEAIVTGTAAAALLALGRAPDALAAQDLAQTLWQERQKG